MIIVFPLVPIIIGIVLLGMSFTDSLIGMIDGITTFLMVAMVIIAIVVFVMDFKALKERRIENKRIILNSIAGIVSIVASCIFFEALCENGNDINGIFSFFVISVLLGPIWLGMVCCWCGTCCEKNSESVKCFIGSMCCAAVMFWLALT